MSEPSGCDPLRQPERRTAALAHTVRERREDLGLCQVELAVLAGCSERFVHTVEKGKPTLRLDKVLDILEVLGLDLELTPGGGRIRGQSSEMPETQKVEP